MKKTKSRFVQVRNPMTKSYIRIDRKLGKIVGHRKKKYKCLFKRTSKKIRWVGQIDLMLG